ncbi:MAG: PD-(D/E)XK nuclease family protein [Lachnospiraceae bacterium]|nr:PD-(D/E)XK nuclease family protein [Lachnospiraceae bacterium]
MSLRFYLAPSGYGKSTGIFREVLSEAGTDPHSEYLVIVPDQFTMQTQKALSKLSDTGGILNIDVLSFSRLSHRIFEEVGKRDIPILDDTGKNLILQRVASSIKDKLVSMGSFVGKQGYISEIKSAISEFKQYGISVEDMDSLIESAEGRGALSLKLKDLKLLYSGFQKYIDNKFLTTEDTLEELCEALVKSDLIRRSVVIFDGFTGFTPIQYRVIKRIMELSREVRVTLALGLSERPNILDGEQKLFHLSKKTYADLTHIADELHIDIKDDVYYTEGYRYKSAADIGFLEGNLFRKTGAVYEDIPENIHLIKTVSPRTEISAVCTYIKRLIMEEGYAYRDIAVVLGDMEGYAPYVENYFYRAGIPFYMDRTRHIILNPLTEYIKSALQLYIKNFDYESVFRFLRTGLSGIAPEEIDVLENYCLKTGIRGIGRWKREYRELFHDRVLSLYGEEPVRGKRYTAREHIERLLNFLEKNGIEKRLHDMAEGFKENQDAIRFMEYSNVYRYIVMLLEQIYELIGDDELTVREFHDILDAGISEIKVGVLPQSVDRVLVGDMERTRLTGIKALFFMGVNDGNIPKNTSAGGIISDMDREYLKEKGLELAPTPREQVFIQRLYLYLNLTKPEKSLYISYSDIGNDGKAIRPSYLVGILKQLFPGLNEEYPDTESAISRIVTKESGLMLLSEGLRDYAEGVLSDEKKDELFSVYEAYDDGDDMREKLKNSAFITHKDDRLSKAAARALYGIELKSSVSGLETYASCAYKFFLSYGLHLSEREELNFERSDLGNMYHYVLENFEKELSAIGRSWKDFSEDEAESIIEKLLTEQAMRYGDGVLYSSKRYEYSIKNMAKVMLRTVNSIKYQLRKGKYAPRGYEVKFEHASTLADIDVSLSEEEKLILRGKIDRIDSYNEGDNIFVKVVDYKSGDRDIDLSMVYYGLQLQLVVYMDEAMRLVSAENKGKNVIPGAVLYYHMDDPVVDGDEAISEEEINKEILKKLKMKGLVNSDHDIPESLDEDMREAGAKSDIIPVAKKSDGTYYAYSKVFNDKEITELINYVNQETKTSATQILKGDVALNPYLSPDGKKKACDYCEFSKVCGFDRNIPGCDYRRLKEMDDWLAE